MAKSITNQRYIYSIDSNNLARNGWDIKISIKDIDKARKNRDLVPVGSSQAQRMINEIIKNTITEEDITNKKQMIKRIKKKQTTKETLQEYKKLKNELNAMMIEPNFINIKFNTKKHFKIACKNGVKVNNVEYRRIVGTSGGVKKNKVYFCSKRVYNKLYKMIRNGYDTSISIVPAKLEAYIALAFSMSTEVTTPKRVLVVKDAITNFKSPVTLISNEGEENKPKIEYINDYETEYNISDGCGLIDPDFMDVISKDLQLDYRVAGINTRWAFCKGMLSCFDFKKYAKDVLNEEFVTDVWGETHNINDVDIILTESMLKLWNGYKNIDHYLKCCDKNGFKLAVAKATPKQLDNERRTNYQYIQALDLDDNKIEKLLRPSIEEIKDVLGYDYRKTILFSKGKNLNDKNVWLDGEDDFYSKALMVNGDVINDTYIYNKVRKSISNKINELKIAKIPVRANYQIICGDPILLMESMFNKPLKGLLKKGEFYSKYWNDLKVDMVAGFRSPMTVKESIVKMNITKNEKCIEWYKYMDTLLIFNGWDNTATALNGAD